MTTRSDVLQLRYEVRGDGQIKASLNETSAGMDRVAQGARRAGAAIGAVLAAGITATSVAVRRAINEFDDLLKASQRVGVGVESLSALQFAAELSGVSFGSLTTAMTAFNRTLEQNEGMIRRVGIQTRDAAGNLRGADAVMRELSDVFASFPDGPEKSRLAMDLFGRSGAELIPLLNQGSDEIQRMEHQAERLGLVISERTARSAERFNDNLTILTGVATGLRNEIAAQLLPNLEALTGQLVESATQGDLLKTTAEGIATVLRFVAAGFATVASAARVAGAAAGATIDSMAAGLDNLKLAFDPSAGGLFGFFSADRRQEFQANVERQRQAFSLLGEMYDEEVEALSRTFDSILTRFPEVSEGLESTGDAAENAGGKIQSIRDILGDIGGGGSGAAAPRDLYGPALEGLERQIALFGDLSNAARVAYDIQVGALGELSSGQRALLTLRAEELDQMQRRAELEREAQQFIEQTRTEAEQYAEVLGRLNELQAVGLINAEQRARIEAQYQPRDRAQELIEDLQFELELQRMNNVERQLAIQLRYLEGEATAEQVEQLRGLNAQLESNARAMQGFERVFSTIGRSGADVATGVRSGRDALRDLEQTLVRMIVENAMQNLVAQWSQAFAGGMGGGAGGGGGGMWASLLGTLFGAPGRATGGMGVRGWQVVGENGPELRYDRSPGQYVPNHQLGQVGGGGSVVNVTQQMMFQGRPDRRTMDQAARATREKLEIAEGRNA